MTQHTVAAPAQRPSLADLVQGLSQFQGPPDQFLLQLLTVQCQAVAADGGAILHVEQTKLVVLAIYPGYEEAKGPPVWARQALDDGVDVFNNRRTKITQVRRESGELYNNTQNKYLVMLPLITNGAVRGVAAFCVTARDEQVLAQVRERLELTMGLLSLYEMRLTLQRSTGDLDRVRMTMETHAAVNDHMRFRAVAMAMCNEVASRWKAQRVSLGFKRGRYIKIDAMSHTEKFTRKTQMVQDLEAVMEESLDQDVEVLYPAPREAVYVSRAAAEFSNRYGPTALCSIPLRYDADTVAVLTVERDADQPFSAHEIESLRLTCDLCTPRLYDLHETDRWFGARAMTTVKRGAQALVGMRHTWAKLTVMGIIAVVLFLTLVRAPYRADASFVIESSDHKVVSSPFGAFIKLAPLQEGDQVIEGETVLMQLDTVGIEYDLAGARAEYDQYMKEADVARSDATRPPAEEQIALARAAQVQSRIRLLELQLSRATIKAPVTGQILKGDWRRQIGAAVDLGQPLFEIAPLDELHADLAVPEDRISEIEASLRSGDGSRVRGEMATAANPGLYIPFEIEKVNPIAEVVDQRNVFRVRVKLLLDEMPEGQKPVLKPGMEGIAKVELGDANYLYIWTRGMVNWVRMKLWI
jgi:hypothetical protein